MNMEPLKLTCNKWVPGEPGACGRHAEHEVRTNFGNTDVPIIRCVYHLSDAVAAAKELYGSATTYLYASKQLTCWGWVEVRDE